MIKMLVMDVDGTLTDGGIYMGQEGELTKRFDVKDGYGIHVILKKNNIIPAVITGRQSKILESRCKELEILECIQDYDNKIDACKKIMTKYSVKPSEVAFIGDDLNDLEIMSYVGKKGCPSNAVKEIKDIADYISPSKGGYGAVRDFIDWLVAKELFQ